MEPIALTFTRGPWHYRQRQREGNLAIYEQRHTSGKVTRYEVIPIRPRPAIPFPNGRVTPAQEAYPMSSEWGTHGWPCFTRAEAEALLAQLHQNTPTASEIPHNVLTMPPEMP